MNQQLSEALELAATSPDGSVRRTAQDSLTLWESSTPLPFLTTLLSIYSDPSLDPNTRYFILFMFNPDFFQSRTSRIILNDIGAKLQEYR
jgi:hypothetical protein